MFSDSKCSEAGCWEYLARKMATKIVTCMWIFLLFELQLL